MVAASGTPHVLAATTTTIPFALVFNWAEHPKDTGWPEWQELPHPQPQPHVNLVGRPAVSSWRSADPALPGEGAVIAARGMNGIIYWTAAQIAPGDNAIPTFQPWETFDATAAAELGAFVATRALLPTDTDLRALLANSGLLATSDPRLALDQHGRVVLAYRGPGYELRIARQAMPSGGSGHTPLAFESMPESFGGILTGTPIPVLVGTELRVYARGTDGGIWVIRPDSAHAGTTPPWESLGFPTGPDALVTSSSPVLGEPEVFVAADGTVHLFAVGRDRQLFHAVHGSRTPLTWTRLGTDVFTGIQVRWATVAEEDNEGRTVDEAGHFILEDPSFSMANGTVTWSPAPYGTDHPLVDPVDAVMASAAIPGIFPPRVLDSKTWVDGGVRRSIPIRAAIDAGATEIVAVAASAAVPARERRVLAATLDEEMAQLAHGYELPPDVGPSDGVSMPAFLPGAAPLDSYANANAIDLGYRAAMDLLPASVLEAEMLPESTYPVPVYPVQPTFDVNDPFTIDPGLVRIAEDYGYMRAADVLVTPGGSIEAAIASSDRITAARRRCWILEQAFIDTCAIVTYRPLYDGLKDWLATFGGQQAAGFFGGPAGLVLSMGSSFDPQVVINAGRVPVDRLVELRANLAAHKDALALLVQDRQAAGFPMPVTSAAWSQLWERHGSWAGSGERVASLAAQPPEAHLRGSWRLQCPWDSSFSLHFPAI